MLKLIATVDWEKAKPVLFVTCTYPDSQECLLAMTLSQHRALFFRALEKLCGKPLPAIWRLEWLERESGARKGEAMPHFHFLIFGMDFIHYGIINKLWKDVLKKDEYVHTDIEAMQNERQCGYYVSKYAAKVCADSLINAAYHDRAIGRNWGVLRKDLLVRCEKKTILVSMNDVLHMAHDLAKRKKKGTPIMDCESFTLLGDLAKEVGEMIFVDHDIG